MKCKSDGKDRPTLLWNDRKPSMKIHELLEMVYAGKMLEGKIVGVEILEEMEQQQAQVVRESIEEIRRGKDGILKKITLYRRQKKVQPPKEPERAREEKKVNARARESKFNEDERESILGVDD